MKNKNALITGSSAGIGYATALQLAHEGAEVIINGRTIERVEKAVAQIKCETGNENVRGIIADFSSAESVKYLIGELPQIDILINNIAIFEPKAFADITDEDWLRFYEIKSHLQEFMLPSNGGTFAWLITLNFPETYTYLVTLF